LQLKKSAYGIGATRWEVVKDFTPALNHVTKITLELVLAWRLSNILWVYTPVLCGLRAMMTVVIVLWCS